MSETAPIIAITADVDLEPENARTRGRLSVNWNYAQAVAEAGGVPIIVPPMADMARIAPMIDGWLIPGGSDIDASHFGEENHPKVDLQAPERFAGERSLYEKVPSELPVLGICYGCQFLNVVRGGSLIQHLPDVEGRAEHTGGVMQTYEIRSDSHVAEILGSDRVEGKSYHHQGVGRVGEGLEAVGRSEDGTIEALEATDRPWVVGLQWHPERTTEDPAMRRLFTEFVKAAAEYAKRRAAPSAG
jgi:putative glutamine amidotransferase